MGTQRVFSITVSIPAFFFAFVAVAAEADKPMAAQVKVAAVQMLGYDKPDVPRPGFDPSEVVVGYVDRAAKDGAQLVVFPEYLLGRISVPGPQTERISKAAVAGRIHVIVGCWEVYKDGSFANTALLFDRLGKIVGKYHKVHAAVDQFEGEPPWSKPPKGKDADWFIRNDPEWAMKRGEDFPVFDLDFGRIGILTCYEGWFPETFRVLSLKGAEILAMITNTSSTCALPSTASPRNGSIRSSSSVICLKWVRGLTRCAGCWPTLRRLASGVTTTSVCAVIPTPESVPSTVQRCSAS